MGMNCNDNHSIVSIDRGRLVTSLDYYLFFATTNEDTPLLLIIDNYDSFTFNLARYFEELGERVIVSKNDAISIQEIAALNPDHLVFSPGPCTPDTAGITLDAVRYFANRLPMLGVCLGHQSIAQAFGGTVVRAAKVMHGKISKINNSGVGLFQGLPSEYQVTRYHSLVVAPDNLPRNLSITASTAHCPQTEIMALQHNELPIFGVQFHPESLLTEYGHRLLQNFIDIGKAPLGDDCGKRHIVEKLPSQ